MLPWVAVLAFTILLIAANAGILAGSRITYNMAKHKQLFAAFSRVHSRYRTPAFAVIVTSGAAVLIILAGMATPNLLLRLGDLYVFSAMLSFSMAHLSVWLLRVKEPDTPRPYKAWPNIRIRGKPISLSASLGLLTTVTIWVMIAVHPEHRFGPMIGIPWIALGIVFYVWFRKREGLDLKRPAVAEEVSPLVTAVPSPRRVQMARSIRHILIPVHRTDAAEQITRIACDLSGLYQADITAVYVVNVPLRLPIDADLPEQTREAEQVLEVASNIADTLYDKKIKTITLQARNVASAIVEYAVEDRADLIILSARHDRASTGEGIVFGPIADFVARRSPSWVWVIGYGAPAARTGPTSGR